MDGSIADMGVSLAVIITAMGYRCRRLRRPLRLLLPRALVEGGHLQLPMLLERENT